MKQKKELLHRPKLLKYAIFGMIVFLGLICLYNCSFIAPGLPRARDPFAFEDGSDPVTGISHYRRVDMDLEDQELSLEVPKSIPVCM